MAASIPAHAQLRAAKATGNKTAPKAHGPEPVRPTAALHRYGSQLPLNPASIPVNFRADKPIEPSRPASFNTLLPLQRKLAVGSSSDPLEAEADAAAKAVRGPEPGGAARRLRRRDVPFAEAPPLVHQVLRAPGQELDYETRGWAETAFQRDFGRVRVHTGEQAEASAASVHARAYTVGSQIVLGSRSSSRRGELPRSDDARAGACRPAGNGSGNCRARPLARLRWRRCAARPHAWCSARRPSQPNPTPARKPGLDHRRHRRSCLAARARTWGILLTISPTPRGTDSLRR